MKKYVILQLKRKDQVSPLEGINIIKKIKIQKQKIVII